MTMRQSPRSLSGRRARVPSSVPAHSVVRKAISSMGGHQRLVLALYYYEHLGPATIAKTLGTPLAEVEQLLDEGKAEVMRALAPRNRKTGAARRDAAQSA